MPPTAADFEKVTLNDNTNAPMEIDIAQDGRVFYIELDGRVQLWRPDAGLTTTLTTIPVTLSHENGLLGIHLAPDFETSRHIYLAYSALPDAAGINRLSRFTLNAAGTSLGEEQIIYTWQHQRQECCHTGGSVDFGPDGNIYLSTGDNTNPFAHGFNPTDERPGRQIWDAQRTSANTNDPNGKILRIRPIPNATGTPGIGTTYTIPAGNMFDESQDTQNRTLPEIYAMGFRNPFRIHVDEKTGWVLMGDYGPDAGEHEPEPRSAGQRRIQRRQAARLLRLAVLRPRERPVPRHHLHGEQRRRHRQWSLQLQRAGQRLAQQHRADQPAAGDPGDDVDGLLGARRPLPGPRRRRRPDRRRALLLRRGQPVRDQVPEVLRRAVVHRRVEQRLDQDRRPSTTRVSPPASPASPSARATSARWTSSSGPTARCTSSSGARASTRTTPTPASIASTTSRARARRSRSRTSTTTPSRSTRRSTSRRRDRMTRTARR